MKITVIGNGWLGNPLRKLLRSNGYDAYSTQRSFSDEQFVLNYPSKDPFTLSFLNESSVIVLAFPPSRVNQEQYMLDCLDVCSHISIDSKVVLISSTGVYDDYLPEVDETSVNYTDVGTSKILLAEKALVELLGDRLCIIRMAGLVGKGRYPVTAMIRSGKSYDENSPINLIHLDDATGIVYYVIQNNIWGETINACAPLHPLKGNYYKWMAKELNLTPPTFIPTEHPTKTVLSNKSTELGYEYKRSDPYQFLFEEV